MISRRIAGIVWANGLTCLALFGCNLHESERAEKSNRSSLKGPDGGHTALILADGALDGGQIEPLRLGSDCFRSIPRHALLEDSMEAVAAACYPGSKRDGPVHSVSISRNRPAVIEFSPTVARTCWSAVVSQGSTSLPIDFDLVDSEGKKYQFGAVTAARSALPSDGPFCPVVGHFRGLVASTSADVSVSFQLAFYADVPTNGSAQ
jgi:hypothetical protein